MSPSPDFKARVLAAARAEPVETRPIRSRRTALVVVASAVVAISVFLALGGVRLGERPIPFAIATIGGWAAVALAAAPVAFGRGKSMLGRARPLLLGVAVAAPLVLFGWIALWNLVYPETTAGTQPLGVRCLAFTFLVAALPLVGLSLVRAERDPIHAGPVGAARGVAAGLLVGVLVDMWCPNAHPAHVAVGHILPLFLLAALGGLLGARVSGVRLTHAGR
jgi:hypothetical protein